MRPPLPEKTTATFTSQTTQRQGGSPRWMFPALALLAMSMGILAYPHVHAVLSGSSRPFELAGTTGLSPIPGALSFVSLLGAFLGFIALVLAITERLRPVNMDTRLKQQSDCLPYRELDMLRESVPELSKTIDEGLPPIRKALMEQAQHLKVSREREQRYYSLFEYAPYPCILATAGRSFLEVNRAMRSLLDYSAADLIGIPMKNIFADPDQYEACLEVLEQTGTATANEIILLARGGSSLCCSFRATLQRDAAGNPLLIHGTFREHSQNTLPEERTRREAELLQNTLTAFAHPFCVIDSREHTVKIANAAAREKGWVAGEKCYRGPHRQQSPCSCADCSCPIDQVMQTREPVVLEHVHRDGDGIPRYLEIHASPIFERDGSIGEIIHYSLDITDRKRADLERIRLEEAVEHATESIVISDVTGAVQYVNPSFEKVSGHTRDRSLGSPIADLLGVTPREEFEEIWFVVSHGEPLCCRIFQTKENGTLYQVEATFSPVKNDDGVVTNVVSVQRDVTYEKELEGQLLHAQKMEAVGTLAGGIAHDFNNILSVVIGFTETTLTELGDRNELAREYLLQVLDATDRARDLIEQVLNFSRGGPHQSLPVDMCNLATETCRFLRSSLPKNLDIRCSTNTSSSVVLADPTQIHQVLMNLCTNAAHAMQGCGGLLELLIDEYNVSPGPLPTHPGLPPGAYLRLVVSDTGHGMNKETMKRIFDPYFSTKPASEGSGLGLSVSHGIVKKYGGAISVESELGKGSSFTVLLPRFEGAAEQPVAMSSPAFVSGRGESILLVDDEPALLENNLELLQRTGYRVNGFRSGDEALQAFRNAPHAFDLVITDQTMPGITGCTLARELLALRPDIPIILCTGYRDDTVEKEAKAFLHAVVKKPFRQIELTRVVHRVLDMSRTQPSPVAGPRRCDCESRNRGAV